MNTPLTRAIRRRRAGLNAGFQMVSPSQQTGPAPQTAARRISELTEQQQLVPHPVRYPIMALFSAIARRK